MDGNSTNQWSWLWRRRTSCCLNLCRGAERPGPHLNLHTHCSPQGEDNDSTKDHTFTGLTFCSEQFPVIIILKWVRHFDCHCGEIYVYSMLRCIRDIFGDSLQGVSKYSTAYRLTVKRSFPSTVNICSTNCYVWEAPGGLQLLTLKWKWKKVCEVMVRSVVTHTGREPVSNFFFRGNFSWELLLKITKK